MNYKDNIYLAMLDMLKDYMLKMFMDAILRELQPSVSTREIPRVLTLIK